MKKIILPAFLCLCCIVAKAQLSFGVKAGVNHNSVRGDGEPFSLKSSTGFHLGAFGSIPLSSKLSLNPELQYIRKQSETFGGNLNYLEVPILFSYNLSSRFSLELGPSMGQSIYTRMNSVGKKRPSLGSVDDLDFGMIGGGKFKISDKVSVVARYNYSFLPFEKFVFNDGPGTVTDTYKFYNSSVQLSVLYTIK
ncbi:MAG: porin family protein [Cyclobacteriaceae bacterium]